MALLFYSKDDNYYDNNYIKFCIEIPFMGSGISKDFLYLYII